MEDSMSFQLQRAWAWTTLAALVSIASVVQLSAGPKPGGDRERDESRIRHVLLLSIDGMHALDFETCVAAGTCPHLAELREHGVTYTRTSAAKPSDSFPGLMALVTGGTPKTVGAYYDVAYDRVLAPPASDTGNGLLHGPCVPAADRTARSTVASSRSIRKSCRAISFPVPVHAPRSTHGISSERTQFTA